LPGFLIQALRSARQARRARGNLGTSLLAEAHRTFWTLTAWSDEASMRNFMLDGVHGKGMPQLMTWCDEAAVVHWSGDDPALPTWAEAHRRLQAEGRRSKVTHPSAAHREHRIPPPVIRGRSRS
jgi:hypothetical protein